VSTAAAPGFTGEQLAELLALIGESDSVELKLTVPESHQRSTVTALGVDPLEAQIRQVVFFDTPDLTLYQDGVVVRARRIQGKGDDSAVKLRPVVPDTLPDRLRRSGAFRVEVDALPGGFVCSGALKGALRPTEVWDALAGERPLRKLFSKEQRAFYAEHAPAGLGLDDLSVLGPIFVLKLKLRPKTFSRKLVAEMWMYPNGGRVVELSTKCLPGEGMDVLAEIKAFLAEKGIDLGGEQQTKTKTALEFFSRELRAPA
jgi:hypothetical protein